MVTLSRFEAWGEHNEEFVTAPTELDPEWADGREFLAAETFTVRGSFNRGLVTASSVACLVFLDSLEGLWGRLELADEVDFRFRDSDLKKVSIKVLSRIFFSGSQVLCLEK